VSSQFAALESPVGESGVFTISALQRPAAQVEAVMGWLASDSLDLTMTRNIS
jgi:gluconate kinase